MFKKGKKRKREYSKVIKREKKKKGKNPLNQ